MTNGEHLTGSIARPAVSQTPPSEGQTTSGDTFATVPWACLKAITAAIRTMGRDENGRSRAQCTVVLARAVFTELACYAGADGECFPYVATIAAELDVSEASVRRAIDLLVEARVVERAPRLEHGRKIGNRYTIPTLRARLVSSR